MKKTNENSPLVLLGMAQWTSKEIRRNLIPLSASWIIGILAHLFAFTNKLVNYDDIQCLFSKGETYRVGRWGLCFIDSIFPNYSMPWIYGIITILLLSVAVCIVIHIFKIESKVIQVLLAGSILVFPALTATVTFLFTLSSYAFAFLLSVLSVWFLQQAHKLRFLPAIVCLVGALSIYQPYLSITASILVLLIIQDLLNDKELLPTIRKGVMYVVFLALSMILYYIATILVQTVMGVEDSLSRGNVSLLALPQNIAFTYRNFMEILFGAHDGLIPTMYSRILHLLCLGCTAVLLLLWALVQKKKELGRFILLAVMILLLPLSGNCMPVIGTLDSNHTLVLYGLIGLFYLLPCVVADATLSAETQDWIHSRCRWICLNLVSICIALIIVFNTYLANEVYLNLYLRYENTHAFFNSITSNLQLTPGFTKDTKLALTGWFDWPPYMIWPTENMMGASGFMPNDYSQERFLEFYLGFEITMATDEEIAQIMETPEYDDMTAYPSYGSIRIIGDTAVVRLS